MPEVPLNERVANERRRLKSVRQALSAAVAKGAGRDPAYLPFYAAIGDYIETAMRRLHTQDVRMGELIRRKLGRLTDSQNQALAEMDERLAGNQRYLKTFLAAHDALRASGATALPAFEAASRDYTHYITTNMGHHGPSTALARDLLTGEDWAWMAGITAEETRREEELHDRVFATLPASLVLPTNAPG
jgi:hypothetical protein